MNAISGPDVETLEAVNKAVLPIIRHHLDALQGDNPLAWRISFQLATERWGEARGLALAHRAQVFLSNILACRPVPMETSDPLDVDQREKMTQDERKLMDLMTAMRSDQIASARELLAHLTGGRVTAQAVNSALSFAMLLETPQSTIRRPAPPKLREVASA
jgi:hypothetical protein